MKRLNVGINEFRTFIFDKKVICFGGGMQGTRAINMLDNWGKAGDIIAFIDNNPQKWGQEITYHQFCYPIVSMDFARKLLQNNIVVLVTCMDFFGIYSQLEQYEETVEIPCTSLSELAQQQLKVSDYGKIIQEYDEPVIPKKIHYCWFGGELPEHLKRNVEKWKVLCPDYEIIEWNESNSELKNNTYLRQAFEQKKWAFVSDYIRLDVLYKYGGIYIDTDVEMVRKPDDLLYQDAFGCFDGTFLVNSGSGIGARPGCQIIKELRDYYENISFFHKDGGIDNTPCTTHSHYVLKKYGISVNDTYQKIQGMNVYPMIFQGSCIYTRQMRVTEKTYFVHYGTATWMGKSIKEAERENGKKVKQDKEGTLVSYGI